MGGLINFLPFVYSVMLVGTLSIMAVPFMTGFYSKDLIIELAFGQYSFKGMYAYILGSVTAGITAFYSFRLISLVFLTVPNGPKQSYLESHESNLTVIIPLFILALFSIFFGFISSDLFVGMGSNFFGNALFIHPNNIYLIEAEYSLPLIIKQLPAILSLLGALLSIWIYHKQPDFIISITNTNLGKKLYEFLNGKYYFDVIYNKYFISGGLHLGYTISKQIDRGIIELLGPNGLSNTFSNTAINIAKLDTGIVTTYALYITIGLLFLISFVYCSVLFAIPIALEFPRLIIVLFFALLFQFHYSNLNITK